MVRASPGFVAKVSVPACVGQEDGDPRVLDAIGVSSTFPDEGIIGEN